MSGYNSVLVAIDVFANEHAKVVEKALELAGAASKLNLIYVAYPQTNFEPYGLFLERDFSEEVRDQAMKKLQGIADGHNVPRTHLHVAIGSAAEEIHEMAKKLNADLIVMGTHGQSGVQLLLGSTANSVLHGIECDLLAVKV
ncbi:universal stress protein [Alteromonas lipolytica]|uniref:Universal stress protein n=1 Tax=Alteromonas lipolytica TaxID=1856405 RepID=A0A1E8FH01_9ALTE|nr:universal stress protein [Alteromonas lipolytica]OFI35210.1 universal stress protein UspA [Alteromonas lipolytica]GGF57641.1 universal stress protein A [Alteromonas lipolytica]